MENTVLCLSHTYVCLIYFFMCQLFYINVYRLPRVKMKYIWGSYSNYPTVKKVIFLNLVKDFLLQ